MKNQIDELTLLLLYLTSFKEKFSTFETLRSWKGYPFDTLDILSENDFISSSMRSKSVYLTEKGIEHSKKLMEKYNIKQED